MGYQDSKKASETSKAKQGRDEMLIKLEVQFESISQLDLKNVT